MKPQEPWIGSRGRIAVIIPSTNIGVEYDCQQLAPPGVTWHFCRFFVEQPDLSSDDMFMAFVDAIRHTGANALDASLKAFGARKVAALTPYQPVGDEQVHRFLEETGYEVSNVVGLKCDTATSIAHTPPGEVIDAVMNQLDGDDVDAIVQAGTNLTALDIFPALEKQLGKPVIPINVATIWHTFRTNGIDDKIFGRGWLLERF